MGYPGEHDFNSLLQSCLNFPNILLLCHFSHCFRSVRLPAEDGTLADEQNSFFSHPMDNDPYFGPILPNSAIAGLVGDEAETFKVSSAMDITTCGQDIY